jgi:hypothetical protein
MKIKLLVPKAVLVLIFLSSLVLGQSPDEMKSRYGKTFNALEIRPGIMMRVQKGNAGQVIELRIEPFSGIESTIHLHQAIDAYTVKEIIDEFVPIGERGNPTRFFGLNSITGHSWSASYDYDFVSIRLLGSTDSDSRQTRNRKRSDNPFEGAEIIVIKWKNR